MLRFRGALLGTDEVEVIQGNEAVSKTMPSGSHGPAACFAYAGAELPPVTAGRRGDGRRSGNQLLPALATLSLFPPSSTVGVASPDLQGELILPSVLEWQKVSFSYIA